MRASPQEHSFSRLTGPVHSFSRLEQSWSWQTDRFAVRTSLHLQGNRPDGGGRSDQPPHRSQLRKHDSQARHRPPCNAASGWSVEYRTPNAPTLRRTTEGVVDGRSSAQTIEYKDGERGDNKYPQRHQAIPGCTRRTDDRRPELTFTLLGIRNLHQNATHYRNRGIQHPPISG